MHHTSQRVNQRLLLLLASLLLTGLGTASSLVTGEGAISRGRAGLSTPRISSPTPASSNPTPSPQTSASPTPNPTPICTPDARSQDQVTPAPIVKSSGNQVDVPTGSPLKSPQWLPLSIRDCANGDMFHCRLLTETYLAGELIFQDPALSDALLKQSCDLFFPTACLRLGIPMAFIMPPVQEIGDSALVSNYQTIVNETDCNISGNPHQCYLAGVAYLDGIGVPKDKERSLGFLNQACKAGVTQACREQQCAAAKPNDCYQAGAAYLDGKDAPVNLQRAKLLLGRACDLGSTDACKRLSSLPATPPPGPAVKEIKAAGYLSEITLEQAHLCDKGLGMGCHYLALLWERGIDVAQDLDRAINYYQQACNHGNAPSCKRLGDIFEKGETGVADHSQAELFFKRAAQLNQTGVDLGLPPSAAYDLGEAYAKGEGVARNLTKARELFDLSCSFWQSGAGCRRVREIQNNTVEQAGSEENLLPASVTPLMRFYARDCDGGGMPACTGLALFYARAHGTPRDVPRAAALLQRACAAHFDNACLELTNLPDGTGAGVGFAGLCDSGDTAACVKAGDHFASPGPDVNLEKAAGYYETACMKQGSAGCVGLVSVGDRFQNGVNAPRNLVRANSLYRTACILGHDAGCGRIIAVGRNLEAAGGITNEDQAIQNFSEACRHGNFTGCGDLWRVASKYQSGNAANPQRVRAIWKSTCENYSSIIGACGNLGVMFEKGEGGPKDTQMALQLYDRDCRRGSTWACTNYYYLEGSLNTEAPWVFNPPNVNQRVTKYEDKRFREYDEVFVRAGGCVQTGGIGKTWKRYVNPSGANSDRLYHGTIWIPGATGPMENLQGVIGKVLRIPAVPHHDTTNLYLRLGFEDEDGKYDDNGFNDFDEGTDRQCANTENAWVVVYVRHHSRPLPVQALPQLLPMDLWWDAIDDNLFPLNPQWGAQVGHPGTLPEAGSLCNYFNNDDDRLSLGGNCTSQRPTVDEPSILENRLNYFICHSNGGQFDHLPGDSVHGHVNWWPVTYTGKIYFTSFEDPFLGSVAMPFGTGDNDYNWALIRDGEEGVLAGNRFQYHNSGKRGITLEFDSREVIDNLTTTWWRSFHAAVDSHPPYRDDWTAAQSMVDGRDAIVIGLMGVDTKHTYHSELHPVFAMAIKISAGAGRERWAIFARNWGNEGGCSQQQHYLPGSTVSFFFPNEGGQDLNIDTSQTEFSAYRAPVAWGAKNYSDGMVVTFNLPQPELQGMTFGQIEFCKGPCNASPLLVSAPLLNLVATATPGPTVPLPSESKPDEGSLKPLLEKLTPDQQKKLAELLKVTVPPVPPLLSHAARRSAFLQPAIRDDSLAISRHRRLASNEARIPVNAPSVLDSRRAAESRRVYDALKEVLGSQAVLDKLLRELDQ